MSSKPKQRRQMQAYSDAKVLAWLRAIDVPVHSNLQKFLEAQPCEAGPEGSGSEYHAEDELGHSSPATSDEVNVEKPMYAYFVDYRLKPIKLDEDGNKWMYTDTGQKITTELALELGLVEPYCKGRGKGNGRE